ncbi:hypothetical protein Y032_0048g1587 [Ancylostoma ceylanicum]|uniref:SCP domain-containing protein n=1 Tax=Ancylostoma ceylanicum TaxID=53326 RepID=A0A016UAA2_9BILA|nr:hypothetical protein Y032_0048g1587 [Ancylostoma ceylanicum]
MIFCDRQEFQSAAVGWGGSISLLSSAGHYTIPSAGERKYFVSACSILEGTNFKNLISLPIQRRILLIAGDIPERTCTAEDGMSNDLQAIAVDMHNYYRRLVGSGWAPDKSGYASPATKMTAVEYDCDTKVGQDSIGKLTKELAATCAPPYQPTQGYSRNYHVEKDLTKSRTEVLKEAIRKWAEQSKLVDLDNGVLFDGDVETYAASFANVVSEQTTKIVCGVTENECQKQGFRVAVCQYDKYVSFRSEMISRELVRVIWMLC